MAFRSADRFGYNITLPFAPGRSYKIPSPPVDVGNFMIESTQLTSQRIALTAQIASLLEEASKAGEGISSEERSRLENEVAELQQQLIDIHDRLQVPKDMEDDYFRSVLGPAYEQMLENKEPFELVKLATGTVSVWVVSGREEAEEFWNNGGRPSRPQRAPQDRKAKKGPNAAMSQ